MPNLLIPLPNTYDSVTRRVGKSVTDKVVSITNIPEGRIEIRGETGVAAQPGSELGDTRLINRWLHEGRVIVTMRETYVDSEVINSAVRHPYAQPIFADPEIGVHIKPVYSNTEMELNFTYRAKSKQEAQMWRDDVKVRMADNRQSHLHQIEYFFPVPDFCSMLLMHMHELRENVAGYGEDLGEYLRRYYTKRAKVLTNQAGNENVSLLVIGEKQVGVQGWFDFDLPIDEEKNEDGPSYLVQFNYKFSYSKPVELNIQYPQIVHNQLIKPDFIVMKPINEDPMEMPNYKSDYRFALDHFDYLARIPLKSTGGLSIPDFDEWIPKNVKPYTTSLINWMVVIEPKDLTLVLSDVDILDTGFLPEFIEWMKGQGNNMVSLGKSPIHFSMYRDDEFIEDGDLEIVITDKAFEVRCKTPADLRQRYHVRMSFCTELVKYTESTLMQMHEDGWNTLRLFQTVLNRLDVEDAQENHMTPDGKLSISYIKRFFGFCREQRTGAGATTPPRGSINNNSHIGQGNISDRPGYSSGGYNPDGSPSNSNSGSSNRPSSAADGGSMGGGGSWYENDLNFGFRLDIPYVMYLTILSQNRNKET